MGGASMMAAGGPSSEPTNFMSVLGHGLAGGAKAYDGTLELNAERAKSRAVSSEAALKLMNSQTSQALYQAFFDKYGEPGPDGYPPEALAELAQIQASTGDEAGARQTFEQIQQLQQTGAKNGMVVGENGFQLAPAMVTACTTPKSKKALVRLSVRIPNSRAMPRTLNTVSKIRHSALTRKRKPKPRARTSTFRPDRRTEKSSKK
ncbi:hypothetical protein [Sinorhizobium psoraleae]|uniref:Uncharacterized protein n=1 Tax=Sinorhizobium psoraleae TaxID=520838 RepID=A0ABT4KB00_9HYPH|nr:hypothetical protein [Sinorhizobium psoraleae]MCZ4089072.1 hypothetical protein [Sinorhizobium psoraleae]